ncbi:MAG: 3-deoxy-7-phosphoheptulonate synthase [Bacteroidetes bacterium]|nr:3-deoxy-7-phosphoheptulonate synthase [Bacteroidota bacterium]MBV6460095.1 Phospho-2-dehydro-3-deoxyheptonate aldolase [Flavobacteriales bacterium]WKZ73966.1 MAG: 3-deoxy-7-phosphoheptulonate synthase [Vicingaceae bacterium]MCL4816445.1 3-deoxy-7-phosphoheptulonate synthase [Flavobacteriales bacterium]NOG95519.1 3-deoxy-7-phosphoheptulonate synthase [Bacteroidota bacterium]
MIVHLKKSLTTSEVQTIADELKAIVITNPDKYVLITPSALKELSSQYTSVTEAVFPMSSDIQLASADYLKNKREVLLGKGVVIGGNTHHTAIIAGPCSVESEEQIESAAQLMQKLGISTLRAGCYKPRTSPYSFQGLGLEGLKLLAKMREKYNLNIITEVRDATHIEEVIEYADIIQIGAKSMYDHGILRRCGKTNKPVLLKRGFGTTLQEFVQAAEFILSGGNENVILCERGIRTFETKTRFTLDLCGAAYLKEYTNLPVILDPSHAIGYAYGVPDLSRACMAMGVDGLLIEVHPNPKIALSDASQQLNHEQFSNLFTSLKNLANAIDRKIV